MPRRSSTSLRKRPSAPSKQMAPPREAPTSPTESEKSKLLEAAAPGRIRGYPFDELARLPESPASALTEPLVDIGPLPPDLVAALNASVFRVLIASSICQILTSSPPDDSLTAQFVAGALRKLRAWRDEDRAAVVAVSNELTVAGGKIARFAQIVEHNAHLAALTFDRKVREAIWKAGDPEGWRQCGLDESRRMDEAVIFNSFEAIRQAFQTLTWPDWDELLAEIQREAAMAAERRRSQQDDAMARAKQSSLAVPFESLSDEIWGAMAWFLGGEVPRPEARVVRAAVGGGLLYGNAISFAIRYEASSGKGLPFITHYGHAALSWLNGQDDHRNPGQDAFRKVKLTDGGFEYMGKPFILTGRPRELLGAMLSARHCRRTVDSLRAALKIDDEITGHPEQVIKDAATDLRRALKAAAAAVGKPCTDPLPSSGKGKDLTYTLEMP